MAYPLQNVSEVVAVGAFPLLIGQNGRPGRRNDGSAQPELEPSDRKLNCLVRS